MRLHSRPTALTIAAALLISLLALPAGAATRPITVLLDGRLLPLDPAPVIVSGRTLVPLRQIFEAFGAQVNWEGSTQTVSAVRGDRYMRFRIGNRLVCLDLPCDQADLMDVPGQLMGDRTYVPLRFIATALGAAVHWDGSLQQVHISSAGPAPVPAVPVTITSHAPGAVVTGLTDLQAQVTGVDAAQIRWFLLDKETGRGPTLAMGQNLNGAYRWRPDPYYAGPRLLAAVAYAADGRIAGSAVVPVVVRPDTSVTLSGVTPEQVVTGPLTLRPQFGFVSTSVRYERIDPATGARSVLAHTDPYADWTWSPGVADNGRWLLAVVVRDRNGSEHESAAVPVQVRVAPSSELLGITAGQTVTGPVSLRVRVNYPVERLQFTLENGTVIAQGTSPGSSYRWFPGPDLNGAHQISATIWGQDGQVRHTDGIPVTVAVEPAVRLATVGKNQVITETVTLKAEVNAPFNHVEFRLMNPKTGQYRIIAQGADPAATYRWTPQTGDDGYWEVQAHASGPAGLAAASTRVPVRVYTGTIYGPKPIVAKDQFVPMASQLAAAARERTGMSAALQVAQAVLETGYGQSVPVDKYTGQLSYNLFGIKGQGPAGSIISNTWEEYGGVAVRVDDYFRAYRSVQESWQDHKEFLLTRDRYAPFREVMTDPIQGAWALRRAGYATDSQYPIKLIEIMKRFNLFALDEVQP